MSYLRAFAHFWWSFVIGDDWRVAATVTAVLGAGAGLVALTDLPDGVLAVGIGLALVLLGVVAIVAPAARRPEG